MERITQVQVRIAEGLKREGVLNAASIAKEYGARVANAKRAADLMRSKGYVTYKDGLYKLTPLGHYAVLRSAAANALRKATETPAPAPQLPLPDPILVTKANGTIINVAKEVKWPEPKAVEKPVEAVTPIATASVTLNIAGYDFTLTLAEAKELRAALNNFFGENWT
jgi:hypothetical protein